MSRHVPLCRWTPLGEIEIELALEQHLWIYSNRFFGGAVKRDLFEAMHDAGELQRNILLTVPIGVDEVAEDILKVDTPLQRGDKTTVELMLQGEHLPDLEFVPDCAK